MVKYSVEQRTDPASLPISVEEFKQHARVDGNDDDVYIGEIISAITDHFEESTNVFLISRNIIVRFDKPYKKPSISDHTGDGTNKWWDGVREGAFIEHSSRSIDIPLNPVSQINSVKTFTIENTEILIEPTNYRLDEHSFPPRIIFNQNFYWPKLTRIEQAVEIDLVSGYGLNGSDIPSDILHSLKVAATGLYSARGDCDECSVENALGGIVKKLGSKYSRVKL